MKYYVNLWNLSVFLYYFYQFYLIAFNYSFHNLLLHLQVENNQINLLFCFYFIIIEIFYIVSIISCGSTSNLPNIITICKTYTWVHSKNCNKFWHHCREMCFEHIVLISVIFISMPTFNFIGLLKVVRAQTFIVLFLFYNNFKIIYNVLCFDHWFKKLRTTLIFGFIWSILFLKHVYNHYQKKNSDKERF